MQNKKENIKKSRKKPLTALMVIYKEWQERYIKTYSPLNHEINELNLIWDIIAKPFPISSPRFKQFQQLQLDLQEIRKKFFNEKETTLKKIKQLQAPYLNQTIAGKTPLHWLIINKPENISVLQLEGFIQRLVKMGADPAIPTASYSRRFVRATLDVLSSFPFLPTMWQKYYYPGEKTAKQLALELHGINIKDKEEEKESLAEASLAPTVLWQKANTPKASRKKEVPIIGKDTPWQFLKMKKK